MNKQITLTIPTDWNGISLKKYLALQKELTNYADDEDALVAIMLQTLCGLDAKYLSSLAVNDYIMLRTELGQFISRVEHELVPVVEWKGVKYGFEPNLSQMTYGAYLDISKYDSLAIDDNWAKIMNILYRPIIDQKGEMYSTKPYTADIDNTKEIEQWGMDVHFGALFFFLHLSTDLVTSIPNYLKELDNHPNTKQILQKSGEVTKQLLNSQGVTLQSLTK
jgi:hypothetical protein